MELDTLYELRKLVDTTLDICDAIEKTGLWTLSGKVRMRHMLQVDLYRFCHYLAASDGHITVKESAFINTVLGINTDINEMLSFIKKENIYSTEFESTVPLIIRGAIEAERKIKKWVPRMVQEQRLYLLIVLLPSERPLPPAMVLMSKKSKIIRYI